MDRVRRGTRIFAGSVVALVACASLAYAGLEIQTGPLQITCSGGSGSELIVLTDTSTAGMMTFDIVSLTDPDTGLPCAGYSDSITNPTIGSGQSSKIFVFIDGSSSVSPSCELSFTATDTATGVSVVTPVTELLGTSDCNTSLQFSLTPDPIDGGLTDFDNIPVGTASAVLTFDVENDSGNIVNGVGAEFSPSSIAEGFTFLGGSTSQAPKKFVNGEKDPLSVEVVPTAAGPFTGFLDVTDVVDGVNETVSSIAMTGFGFFVGGMTAAITAGAPALTPPPSVTVTSERPLVGIEITLENGASTDDVTVEIDPGFVTTECAFGSSGQSCTLNNTTTFYSTIPLLISASAGGSYAARLGVIDNAVSTPTGILSARARDPFAGAVRHSIPRMTGSHEAFSEIDVEAAPVPADASSLVLTDARSADARVVDARVDDARVSDARVDDAPGADARAEDARFDDAPVADARVADAGITDAPSEALMPDARDASPEAGTPPLEAGSPEAGSPEAGSPEAGSPEAGIPDDAANTTSYYAKGCNASGGSNGSAALLSLTTLLAISLRRRRVTIQN